MRKLLTALICIIFMLSSCTAQINNFTKSNKENNIVHTYEKVREGYNLFECDLKNSEKRLVFEKFTEIDISYDNMMIDANTLCFTEHNKYVEISLKSMERTEITFELANNVLNIFEETSQPILYLPHKTNNGNYIVPFWGMASGDSLYTTHLFAYSASGIFMKQVKTEKNFNNIEIFTDVKSNKVYFICYDYDLEQIFANFTIYEFNEFKLSAIELSFDKASEIFRKSRAVISPNGKYVLEQSNAVRGHSGSLWYNNLSIACEDEKKCTIENVNNYKSIYDMSENELRELDYSEIVITGYDYVWQSGFYTFLNWISDTEILLHFSGGVQQESYYKYDVVTKDLKYDKSINNLLKNMIIIKSIN